MELPLRQAAALGPRLQWTSSANKAETTRNASFTLPVENQRPEV